jgi:DNA (cytosine-5)-methyltransferase 1
MMIAHYDLFAGIGGFSLALEEVFTDEPIRHIFCEWEKFPTAVLKQHWPDGEYWGDIANLVADTERKGWAGKGSDTTRQHGQRNRTRSDQKQDFTIVTGGFPCQPFSAAGRRKGTADDRYQWPNMYEVIRNTKPDWVIAENVRGLVTWNDGMVLEQVCADLESQGYEVQPFIIPAVAVNAPHRRDRVWIIGHKEETSNITTENAGSLRPKNAQDPISERVERRSEGAGQVLGSESTKVQNKRPSWADWSRDWQEVAFKTCDDTVDDGLSRDVGGLSYSAAKWRKEGLKAYGNAIVPQVAMEIMRAIKEQINDK